MEQELAIGNLLACTSWGLQFPRHFFKKEGLANNFESESYCSPFANLNTQLFFSVYTEHVIICLTGKYHSHGERRLIDTFTKPASGDTESIVF